MNTIEKFEELKKDIITVAKSYSSKNFEEECLLPPSLTKEIESNLEGQKLNIGIIGQMKYGKSTFINAFLFRSPFLPVSDTPMTAALTSIEYGDKNEYVVEFFSEEDIEKIKDSAEVQKDNQAFQEAVEKLEVLLSDREVRRLMGKEKHVSPDEIKEYVGADGKFVPLTKILKIKANIPQIKGSVIVDTPGFNDPVESREKRTQDFLQKADVLIVFLYAQRPFDETDKSIIVDRISKTSGSGKVVVVLNKADMIMEGKNLKEVENYVKEVYKKTIEKEIDSKRMKEMLLSAEVIPLSSLLALLGRMDDTLIKEDEDLLWYFNEFKKKFSLQSQKDFEKLSNIKTLEDIIYQIIREDKMLILLEASKQKIFQYFQAKINELKITKRKLEREKDNLSKSKEEIKKELKKLKTLEDEIEEFVDDKLSEVNEKIEQEFDNAEYSFEKECKNIMINYEKKIRERHVGFLGMKTGKFNIDVRSDLNQAYFDLKDKARENIRELNENLKKILEDFLECLFLELDSSKWRNFVDLEYKDKKELRNQIYNSHIRGFGEEELGKMEFTYFKVRKGLICVSDEDAQEQALKMGEEKFKEVGKIYKSTMKELKHTIQKLIADSVSNKIFKDFKAKILKPIKDSYPNAEEEFKSKDKRLKEIKLEMETLDEKIHKFKANMAKITDELKKIENKY